MGILRQLEVRTHPSRLPLTDLEGHNDLGFAPTELGFIIL